MTMSPSLPDPDRLPPARFALDRWTWREIAYLLANLPVAVVGFVYTVAVIGVGAGLSVTVIGLPLLVGGLQGARLLGGLERRRARWMLGVRVEEPSPLGRGHRDQGFFVRLWAGLKDPVGWRALLYGFIRLPWGVLTFAVTLVSLFVLWPVLPFIARGLTTVDRAMVRGLLSPSDELERRIAELESDRGVVVDTAAADLRRIERDLHDGAQARLVPAVLTDRGLDAALSAIASRCTVPVKVSVGLRGRPAEAIEGIAYFTVSELLQNVSKHSGARSASVEVWRSGDRLLLQVTDDGGGGARLDGGSGLAGLAERLDAVDGVFVVDSPEGGPTTVTAELPWRDRTVASARTA
ncbi:sensor histidine kinase [Streptomyces griseus]|uniref:sensor histidine kinase n=1 Tax=Streptomyces griseus TaxID=1911 RepID=UPI0004CAB226|nr:sensor histidine kinase [Streptomyces griseus]